MHFIYVMTKKDKEKMLDMGFHLVKTDPDNHIWVFENSGLLTFDAEDRIAKAGVSFVLSDTLTF